VNSARAESGAREQKARDKAIEEKLVE